MWRCRYCADQKLAGVLRTSIPVTAIDARLGTIRWRISVGALLIALLASLGSWYASRTITRPLEKMRDGARQFAAGILTHRLPLYDIHEFSALAETLNQMAEQLQQRLEEITSQRNNTDAVLSSMHEGVIAIDLEQQVISINRAAAKMFGIPMQTVHGAERSGDHPQPRVSVAHEPKPVQRREPRIGYFLPPERGTHLSTSTAPLC